MILGIKIEEKISASPRIQKLLKSASKTTNCDKIMHHYISPQEVKHWIPKARLHIKHALQELEYPEYKNNLDATCMTMVGTESITPISYSYGSLGLAFELIYKTFAVSNFKPLYLGSRGHKIENIHKRLNKNTQKMIEGRSVNLISNFNYYPSENYNFYSIMNEIDNKMVNANVKYNNIPQKEYPGSNISKQATFDAFGYNRTQIIIQFMREISEVAYNMLGLSHHIITNTERICPEFSHSNKDHKELIFEECSQFISDFEIKIQNQEILITASETTINRLYPNSLSIIYTMGLHNSFNNKSMNFVVKGKENAGKELYARLIELGYFRQAI